MHRLAHSGAAFVCHANIYFQESTWKMFLINLWSDRCFSFLFRLRFLCEYTGTNSFEIGAASLAKYLQFYLSLAFVGIGINWTYDMKQKMEIVSKSQPYRIWVYSSHNRVSSLSVIGTFSLAFIFESEENKSCILCSHMIDCNKPQAQGIK